MEGRLKGRLFFCADKSFDGKGWFDRLTTNGDMGLAVNGWVRLAANKEIALTLDRDIALTTNRE